jgi:hypothetical protein
VLAISLFPGDSALMLFLLVVGAFTLLGLQTDGLRMGMLFVGTLLALIFAPMLEGVLGKFINLPEHPLWWELGAGKIWAFVFLMTAVLAASQPLHRKLHLHIKHALDNNRLAEWDHVNSIAGITLGGILGVLYLMLLAGVITPLGYAATQLRPSTVAAANEPMGYRLAARLHRDFRTLGLDKSARLFDPASARFYDSADISGLLYHNLRDQNLQAFRARLLAYPALVEATHTPHLLHLLHLSGTNMFLMGIYNQTNATHLLHHAHVRGAMVDESLRKKLSQVDTRDLLQYLRTGKSHLSDPAKLHAQNRPVLLGGWELDVPATQQQFEAIYPKMNDRERKKVREYLEALEPTLMLSFSETTFYLDGRYFSNRPLGVKPPSHRAIAAGLPENGLLPRVPASPRMLSQLSVRTLLAGPWNSKGDVFHAKFIWPHTQPQASCEVEFQEFSNRLLVTLKDFNNEVYVFRRTGSAE